MDYLDTLSQFSSNLDYRTLDADVKDQVGWILADTVAAMAADSHRESNCADTMLLVVQCAGVFVLGRRQVFVW